MKKPITVLFVLFILMWPIKIISINNEYPYDIKISAIGETVVNGEVEITPVKGGVLTVEEYKEYVGAVDMDLAFAENRGEMIFCILLHVKNVSGESLRWENVFRKTGYGFQSTNWMSSVVPQYTMGLNIVHNEKMEPGEEADFWFATGTTGVSFGNEKWNHIKEIQFYYVLDVYPNALRIKLPTVEESR